MTVIELFFSDASLWNQEKYLAFNIFSCRNLIISYEILIITGISNKTADELTVYVISSWNISIIYQQKQNSFFQMQEKLKTCRNSKWNFSCSCFIADDSYVKTVWWHLVAYTEYDTLYFLRLCPFIKILFSKSISKLL